jgi:hypothetical protein
MKKTIKVGRHPGCRNLLAIAKSAISPFFAIMGFLMA